VEHKIRMIPFSDVERILSCIDEMQKEMSNVLKPYEIKLTKWLITNTLSKAGKAADLSHVTG